MSTIDLNRVRLFVRVAEAGSFTGAARLSGLPTSSVSRAVAALERELAVRLIQRTTRWERTPSQHQAPCQDPCTRR